MTLIKSIDSQTMEKIQFSLSQKIISAADKEILLKDLTREIQEIAGVSERRAVLIGADQVGKLNGRLVQYRQQSAGIEYFIWRTMGDNRVRPNHAAKNGVVYRWDSPVEKPGEAVRCRCVAQPVIDENSFKLVPLKNSYTNKNISAKMSATDKPHWAERDKLKILSKEEYKKLRDLADSNKIALSGVKSFDGKFETIKETIETLAKLQNDFPKVVSGGKRLTLTLNENLDAADFAVTTKIRNINLNANAYRDLEKLKIEYQKAVEEGWFVKGTDYRAIIHHEFGHVVANTYNIDSLKIACKVTGLSPKRTMQFVQENISEYAGSFPNGKEIISEVFADMTTNNPSEFSEKFYSEVLKICRGSQK